MGTECTLCDGLGFVKATGLNSFHARYNFETVMRCQCDIGHEKIAKIPAYDSTWREHFLVTKFPKSLFIPIGGDWNERKDNWNRLLTDAEALWLHFDNEKTYGHVFDRKQNARHWAD